MYGMGFLVAELGNEPVACEHTLDKLVHWIIQNIAGPSEPYLLVVAYFS